MAEYTNLGRSADNIRLVGSKTIINPADGTHNVIKLPQYAFVTKVWIVITDASSAGTITIGHTGNGEVADADGFMDAAATAATALGTKCSIDDGQPASVGKWFNAAGGMITITTSSANDGTYTIFAEYMIIH